MIVNFQYVRKAITTIKVLSLLLLIFVYAKFSFVLANEPYILTIVSNIFILTTSGSFVYFIFVVYGKKDMGFIIYPAVGLVSSVILDIFYVYDNYKYTSSYHGIFLDVCIDAFCIIAFIAIVLAVRKRFKERKFSLYLVSTFIFLICSFVVFMRFVFYIRIISFDLITTNSNSRIFILQYLLIFIFLLFCPRDFKYTESLKPHSGRKLIITNRLFNKCHFCKTKISKEDVKICSNCGLKYHKTCWDENGIFTIYAKTNGTLSQEVEIKDEDGLFAAYENKYGKLPSHKECWKENRCCSSIGCASQNNKTQKKPYDSMCINGFILGIASATLYFLFPALPILATITSLIGLSKLDKQKQRGKALGVWGLVLGMIYTIQIGIKLLLGNGF